MRLLVGITTFCIAVLSYHYLFFALLITTTIIAGCGQSAEEPATDSEAAPEASGTPEDAAEAEATEPEGVAMP